ncbi:MAG: CsbD family protein [Bacteroidota bacterium]
MNDTTEQDTQHDALRDARNQQAEGQWQQFSGRLQEAWGALTNSDVDRYEGQREQLIGAIQEKTGEAREAIVRSVDDLAREVRYRFG